MIVDIRSSNARAYRHTRWDTAHTIQQIEVCSLVSHHVAI